MRKIVLFLSVIGIFCIGFVGNCLTVLASDSDFYFVQSDYSFPTGSVFTNNLDSHDSDWLKGTWTFGVNDTLFQESNVIFDSGIMTFNLEEKVPAVFCANDNSSCNYVGGHYQSNNLYGYGTYEVRMQPATETGVVSSFFLFSDDELSAGRWAEIDFEFLKDNELQVTNFDAPGKDYNETKTYTDLGFDPSLAFHDYKLEYFPNVVRWYVDGVLIREETHNIPTEQTMKIMMNAWVPIAGDTRTWAGGDIPVGTTFPITTKYESVEFTPYTSTYNPYTFQFFDNSDVYATSWAWDFNNDGIVDSTDQHPRYTYTTSGTYTVKLVITDQFENSYTQIKTDYITILSEAICGNGTKEGSEQCDDGNDDNMDGCTSECKQCSVDWDGIGAGPAPCSPTDDNDNQDGDLRVKLKTYDCNGNEESKKIEGSKVKLYERDGDKVETDKTNSKGEANFRDIETGKYKVKCEVDGYISMKDRSKTAYESGYEKVKDGEKTTETCRLIKKSCNGEKLAKTGGSLFDYIWSLVF